MKNKLIIVAVVILIIAVAVIAYMKAKRPELVDYIVKEGGIDRDSLDSYSFWKLMALAKGIKNT